MGKTQATVFQNLTEAQAVNLAGPLCRADYFTSGILASVTLAQFILESGYGKSELCQNANNAFGMKANLSGNKWSGSTWGGEEYTKETKEQKEDGTEYTVTAAFRKYGCLEDSIADHSAYLLGAKNGKALRYKGLKGCTDYKKAAQIIKDGGYATDVNYVDKLCGIIEKWNLTQYDAKTEEETATEENATPQLVETVDKSGDKQDGNSGSKAGTNSAGDSANNSGTPILYGKLKTLMNIRKGNSVSSERITTYKKNTIIEILEVCDNGWYRIRCREASEGYAYVSNVDGIYAYTGKSVYTVKKGDTLWKIAGEMLGDPKRNPEIKAANGLTSTVIITGMKLLIP